MDIKAKIEEVVGKIKNDRSSWRSSKKTLSRLWRVFLA